MIRAYATCRGCAKNEIGRPPNDTPGLVVIGGIIVALLLVIVWQVHGLGSL